MFIFDQLREVLYGYFSWVAFVVLAMAFVVICCHASYCAGHSEGMKEGVALGRQIERRSAAPAP